MSYATLKEFEYFAPTSIQEAVSLSSRYGREGKIIVGGTDLVVLMNRRRLTPRYVINIGGIRELDFLQCDGRSGLRMGANCSLRRIEKSDDVKENFPLLVDAVRAMASVQIRNVATIGGNLCNASPAADTVPPLLVIDSQATVVGEKGERSVPLDGFFLGPGRTVIEPGEILSEIDAPPLPPGTATAFVKIGRTPTDISKVSVAVLLTVNGRTCQEVRIALGAVAPTPIRAKRAEEVLRGRLITDQLIEQSAIAASDEAKPITDVRSTSGWRKIATRNLVRRLLSDSLRRVAS